MLPAFNLIFSDTVNHGRGMQNFGMTSNSGFKNEDIIRMYSSLDPNTAELHNIKNILPKTLYEIPDAFILVMRQKLKDNADEILPIFNNLLWDSQRLQNGKLVESKINNKLLFCDLNDLELLPANFNEKYGTIHNINRMDALMKLYKIIESNFSSNLYAEGIAFNDLNECYVPMGQEKDKKKIIGLHLGSSFPLNFRWYHKTEKVSDPYQINLNHGDLYIMSEMAAGLNKESKTKLYIKHGHGFNKKAIA